MHETEPQYFKEFRKDLDNKLEGLEIRINEKFESHAEQIAEVSEKLSVVEKDIKDIKLDIRIMKGDIVLIKEELKWKEDKVDRPMPVFA